MKKKGSGNNIYRILETISGRFSLKFVSKHFSTLGEVII